MYGLPVMVHNDSPPQQAPRFGCVWNAPGLGAFGTGILSWTKKERFFQSRKNHLLNLIQMSRNYGTAKSQPKYPEKDGNAECQESCVRPVLTERYWCLCFLRTQRKLIFYILVRTHLLVLRCQHSCMLLVIIDQIYRKRSRSILIMV